jgi:hypothetical protein
MATVRTTLVVRFDAGEQSGVGGSMLKAEIDDRESGLNAGKTQFRPGDSPYYLVYRTSDVTITQHRSSAGVIATAGPGVREVTEYLEFADEQEASLSYPVSGSIAYTWLGNNLGRLQLVGQTGVKAATKGVGRAKVTYQSAYQAYRLSNVPQELGGETSFDVLILIAGTTPS